ncbi:MAG: HDIG domain-containing protein [Candidatus Pacebacteria bacterium]|nr:HDIG domain-containing protein [Candidatus Paceibacterota bacterium]
MELQLELPPQVDFILDTLESAGYEAYIVGGAVRDLLMKRSSNYDYDFTTDATPEKILELFPDAFYENNFGTVMVTHTDLNEQIGISPEEDLKWQHSNLHTDTPTAAKSKLRPWQDRIVDIASAEKIHESLIEDESLQDLDEEPQKDEKTPQHHIDLFPNYEITTFRSDGAYQDHRRPEEVTWGKTLKEDVDRRDFTINALALKKISSDKEKRNNQHKYEVIDYHNGIEDLKAEKIKTVGDPNLRFKEDALRILRAIRFSVQLNMEIDDETYQAIGDHAHLIEHISWERIRDEFLKILGSDFPAEGVEILDETHLLEYIMPELLEGKGVKQGGHHITDVWTHSLDALRETPSVDPIVRLATLMHDIAKPRTYALKNGDITFYNHEIVGSRMASKIAKRLRLSKKNIQRIFILVRQHMFHYQQHNTDAAIRRFMRKVGLGNIDDILDLREGDRLGSGAKRTSWRLEEMKQRMIQQLNQPMEVKDLKIDGNDLMKEFDLKPGRILGDILNHLFELVLEDPKLNTKETLFKLSKKYLESITL